MGTGSWQRVQPVLCHVRVERVSDSGANVSSAVSGELIANACANTRSDRRAIFEYASSDDGASYSAHDDSYGGADQRTDLGTDE